MQFAGLVESSEIAHPEPAVAKRLGVRLRIVEIPGEHLRAAHLDLADRSGGNGQAVGVDQTDFGSDRRAERSAAPRRRRQALMSEGAGLGRRETGKDRYGKRLA